MGVFFCQISFKGSEVGSPWFISSFCSAHNHVLCCFRLVAVGVSFVGLLLSRVEGWHSHHSFQKRVWGFASAITELQGSHEVSACIPIHIGDGLGWNSTRVVVVILAPIVDCVVIFQNGVNDIGVSTAELLAFVPNGIAFISNVEHGRDH